MLKADVELNRYDLEIYSKLVEQSAGKRKINDIAQKMQIMEKLPQNFFQILKMVSCADWN